MEKLIAVESIEKAIEEIENAVTYGIALGKVQAFYQAGLIDLEQKFKFTNIIVDEHQDERYSR